MPRYTDTDGRALRGRGGLLEAKKAGRNPVLLNKNLKTTAVPLTGTSVLFAETLNGTAVLLNRTAVPMTKTAVLFGVPFG
jgi:hypothetical protein